MGIRAETQIRALLIGNFLLNLVTNSMYVLRTD